MRRSNALILKILEYVESMDKVGAIPIPTFNGYGSNEVDYHVTLCCEAKYLIIEPDETVPFSRSITRLTWTGHEVIGLLRRELS